MNKYIIAALALVLSGCASQIMQSYVGKDINEVILDYGPPSNVLELEKGKRAYQFVRNSSYTTPITTYTTGYGYGNSGYTTVNAVTNSYGGQTYNDTCVYTLLTRANEAGNWIIESFRQPNIMCE